MEKEYKWVENIADLRQHLYTLRRQEKDDCLRARNEACVIRPHSPTGACNTHAVSLSLLEKPLLVTRLVFLPSL